MEKFYKVLDENMRSCHGGTWQWEIGVWTPVIEDIEPCVRGWHACRRQDVIHWLGPVICEAEIDPVSIGDANKIVTRQMRLLRRIETWNDTTARLFAADCAERVLPIFEARRPLDDRPRRVIQAAREFALGRIGAAAWAAARAAARAAAWDAASDAAWDAASDAAWDAAWDAARDAAWDAARAAASDAARAAARAAAWDAAKAAAWAAADAAAARFDAARAAAGEWQTNRLFDWLEGRMCRRWA